MRKKNIKGTFHKIKCSGCGRYEKEVTQDVVTYFCCHCFTFTPNYLRYKKGLPTYEPISDLKRGDLVKDCFGNTLKITKKAFKQGNNFYFYGYNVKDKKKEDITIADFHIISKIDD